MKKLLFIAMLFASFELASAQNYDTLYIQDVENYAQYHYCADTYEGVVIYGDPNWNCQWQIGINGAIGDLFYADYIVISNSEPQYQINYIGGGSKIFYVFFHAQLVASPFSEPVIWKRQNETITLTIEGGNFDPYDYEYLWSNGSNEWSIEVTTPGIYYVTITSIYGCGSETFSVEVRDNTEIESASVDPESNKNLITWEVTPAQAEYISNVIVNRDGVDLVTVPYINGEYLDNIGSDLAARIYTVTGVSVEGTPCPIPSLERGTIHMAFLPDINGNVEMTWNSPELGGANIHVGRYEICEYDPNGKGGITVIDFVGPSTMSYSCNQSMFDYGYPLIRAIIQDGRGEKDMLSNRTEDLVGLDEIEGKVRRFEIYPNPSNGPVTIKSNEQNSENEFTVTITNLMGQTVATGKTEGGVFTINEKLASGIYFVDFGGNVQKLVVE